MIQRDQQINAIKEKSNQGQFDILIKKIFFYINQ